VLTKRREYDVSYDCAALHTACSRYSFMVFCTDSLLDVMVGRAGGLESKVFPRRVESC